MSSSITVQPFINGAISRSASDATFEVVNPSNGRHLQSIPAGCDIDVNGAVSSARRAFVEGAWSTAPPSFRRDTLTRFAQLISINASSLDRLDAGEMGKPIKEAYGCAADAASLMRFYAEAIDKISGDVHSSDHHSLAIQRWVSRGVVAAVVPWNFPTSNAVMKIAPALAAGNSIVLKPSELASRSAMTLAQLAIDAGVPSGVFNVVPGLGETVGRALGAHPDVDMVTFTGSTSIGKQMLQYAAQSNMKVVMLECGGKAPHIVFADTLNLDAVARNIAQLLLTNQGQICAVGSRLLVERSIEGRLIEKILESVGGAIIGDALDPNTTFGPLVSAQQCARVMRYIEIGRSEGATLITGGRRSLLESGGFFVEPTIFRNVAPTARIAQDEIFGPVLTVTAFDEEAEAINLANSTVYGLIAYAWTSDLSRAMRLMKGVRSSIFINAVPPMGEGPGSAFSSEPAGQSGIGTEGGLPGMESYMRRQAVVINHA